MNPAIVIPCYRRTQALRRLLTSLSAAVYPSARIPLVISVDHSGGMEVADLAASFAWPHGTKKIIRHEQHLGLRDHILYCGDLTRDYGAVIVLEDDLLVSPGFYGYSQDALRAYQHDDRIGGISLYCARYNETARRPFRAIDDGSDVYFLQLASSWGEAWTERQWAGFRAWLGSADAGRDAGQVLPENVRSWSSQSWKKRFNHYLVQKDRYFVYPRRSLTTNFAELGEHVESRSLVFQVPMLVATDRTHEFRSMDQSRAIYDAYHEIKSTCLVGYNSSLAGYDFAVDLYASKDLRLMQSQYVLTTRQACVSPVMAFSGDLTPHDANVALNLPGNDIVLCETRAVSASRFDRYRQLIYGCRHDLPFLGFGRSLFYGFYLALQKLLRKSISWIRHARALFKLLRGPHA